jgi:sodium transport system permease protein
VGRGSAFSPFEAIGIMSATLATLIVLGVVNSAVAMPLVIAAIVGELALLVMPVVARVVLGKRLGVTRTRWRLVAGAALIGISAWYLNLRLIDLLPIPEGEAEHLRRVVEQPSLVATMLAIAVLPAVCEEVLFRGVVFRGLATRFVPWAACLMSAAVFAAYHMNFGQLVPTFLIGIVLAWITSRAQSVVPAMAVHLLNNVAGVLVSRDQPAGIRSMFEHHPAVALCTAAVLTGAGIAIVARSPTA